MSIDNKNTPNAETILKKLTVELLRNDSISVVDDVLGAHTDKVNAGNPLSEQQSMIFDALGIGAIMPDIAPDNRLFAVNKVLTHWLLKAETLKLASSQKESINLSAHVEGKRGRVDITKYSITSNGLETALKLQEHDDNERRFKQQKDISETLKDNSNKSVTTARVALAVSVVLVCFGGYRVYQLEQKILSHSTMEARINSTDKELGKLLDKNDLLVKELEAFKNKPVTAVVAQVDDTHQTKNKER